MPDNYKKHGGARKNAGRKKGIGVVADIKRHCELFIVEILKDDAIRNRALKDIQKSLFEDESESYVYVIETNGLYKIGYASDWQKRAKQYGVHNPDFRLIFLYKGFDAFEVESYLHKKYHQKNQQGEWFSLSSEDLLCIVSYCSKLIS